MAQRLGNVPVGQVVKLKENGSPVNYLVVHQGRPSSIYDASCNGTWLLRQDIAEEREWDIGNSNVLESSDIHAYLNNTWIDRYEAGVKPVIKQVKIPYRQNGGSGGTDRTGANGLSCKIFLLSGYELGWTTSNNQYFPADGAKLAYFESGTGSSADAKRVAKLNGSATHWWPRSPHTSSTNYMWAVYSSGNYYGGNADYSYGVRPALVLPPDLLVDDSGLISGDTYPIPPTTITVPTDPVPTGSTIAVSWSSVSGVTYQLQRSVDGGSWEDLYNGGGTSYNDTAGVWDRVQYRVASVKNGITSAYMTSTEVAILPYPVETIFVPVQAMEGQPVPVSWSPAEAANTYVLERKSSAADWTQIYSGADLMFRDTAEKWTQVWYRVKAGKDGLFGVYTTSPEIPVVPASALAISGEDGDLGTLTQDVPYTISTDTGNPITLERYVNGILAASLTVESGQPGSIPVMELPTGAGTIKLAGSVATASGAPVTVTRTWTYSKTAVRFPHDGGPALLRQEKKTVLPITLAECVRTPGYWGGSLDKTLELFRNYMLRASTAELYGLGPQAVPDDVFVILALGVGKYGYGITVQYPDGTPAAGLPVSGVTDRHGKPITTDENGYFLAVSTEKSIQFSVSSPYFDLSGISGQVVNSSGIITKQTVEFAYKTFGDYVLITNSQDLKFFGDYTADFTAVGGGGGGRTHTLNNGIYGGAGGGGGYVTTVKGVSIRKDNTLRFSIGSGGSNLDSHDDNATAGAGGATSVSLNNSTIVTAAGGNGGYSFYNPSNYTMDIIGGAGNGKGGDGVTGSAGVSGTKHIFDDESKDLAGGGGGGGCGRRDSGNFSLPGGAPHGARGSDGNNTKAQDPTGPGGGGGGGLKSGVGSSSGHAGAVYMRLNP